MTTFDKAKELILKVQSGKLDPAAVTPGADLRTELGFDSLAMMELIVLTEEAFNIKIAVEDAIATNTPADMVAYLDRSTHK